MWTLVLKRLRERRDSAKSPEEGALLSEIVSLASTRQAPNQFVASFSEDGDDLTQWRAYCPGEAGFSIGFSSAALFSQWISDPAGGEPSFVGSKFLKICYLNENNTSEVDLAIDRTLELATGLRQFLGGESRQQQAIVAWLGIIAPSYKNSAYRAEGEWRMVLSKPDKPMPGQRFRTGKSTLIPYVEVELNRDTSRRVSNEYMVRKVLVGPTPSPDLSLEALQSLFVTKGHSEVVVEKSAIPYRHW